MAPLLWRGRLDIGREMMTTTEETHTGDDHLVSRLFERGFLDTDRLQSTTDVVQLLDLARDLR